MDNNTYLKLLDYFMSKYNSSFIPNLDLVDTGQCEVDITTVHMCSYIFTPSVKDYEAPLHNLSLPLNLKLTNNT